MSLKERLIFGGGTLALVWMVLFPGALVIPAFAAAVFVYAFCFWVAASFVDEKSLYFGFWGIVGIFYGTFFLWGLPFVPADVRAQLGLWPGSFFWGEGVGAVNGLLELSDYKRQTFAILQGWNYRPFDFLTVGFIRGFVWLSSAAGFGVAVFVFPLFWGQFGDPSVFEATDARKRRTEREEDLATVPEINESAESVVRRIGKIWAVAVAAPLYFERQFQSRWAGRLCAVLTGSVGGVSGLVLLTAFEQWAYGQVHSAELTQLQQGFGVVFMGLAVHYVLAASLIDDKDRALLKVKETRIRIAEEGKLRAKIEEAAMAAEEQREVAADAPQDGISNVTPPEPMVGKVALPNVDQQKKRRPLDDFWSDDDGKF